MSERTSLDYRTAAVAIVSMTAILASEAILGVAGLGWEVVGMMAGYAALSLVFMTVSERAISTVRSAVR